jgi:hypothetical protein
VPWPGHARAHSNLHPQVFEEERLKADLKRIQMRKKELVTASCANARTEAGTSRAGLPLLPTVVAQGISRTLPVPGTELPPGELVPALPASEGMEVEVVEHPHEGCGEDAAHPSARGPRR